MPFKIQFLGAAGTVTGSKYLITHANQNFLIDCGLFQGIKNHRLKNWNGFPIEVENLSCIILTHAHLDHSGYIPRLVKKGFKGPIYSTPATFDLCKILLPDAGRLAEEEADYLNEKGRTKHHPALPLFTEKEAEEALSLFRTVPNETEVKLNSHVKFELRNAGHILGASSVILDVDSNKVAFSGDIGRMNDPIFFSPSPLPKVKYLITESTYGNRIHEKTDPEIELQDVILETHEKRGVVLIPAFAVGRAQSMLYYLWKLRMSGRIPNIPIYLNSPMATDVTALLRKYGDLHKLTAEDCKKMGEGIHYVHTTEDSISLNKKTGPMIIVSASGMLTGGRILHHLKAFAPFPNNTILLTGFQAAGTRGDSLLRGAKEIKIHGEYVPVRALVKVLDNMSAHADSQEIIDWFSWSRISPQRVFITHGEPAAADELRRRLNDKFGWNCSVPELGETVILGEK